MSDIKILLKSLLIGKLMESAGYRGDLKQVQELMQQGTVGVNEWWRVDDPLFTRAYIKHASSLAEVST